MQPSRLVTCTQAPFLRQVGRCFMRLIVVGMICDICVTVVYSEQDKTELPCVIPRPRIEEYGQDSIPVAGNGKAICVRISRSEKGLAKPIEEGLGLLSRRLGLLGGAKVEALTAPEHHQIIAERCSDQRMSEILRMEGIREEIDERRLAQAYYLRAQQYLEMLRRFMDAGAYGVQVDYNDWGNTTHVPIEDVLNLVCRGLAQRHPDAIVLWCPPQRGAARYRGPASDEMARILSEVPETIWPLWVGLDRNEKILKSETVRAWTDKAGRKPFCWVIGVSATDICSRPIEGLPNARVFRGERLPKNLHELFEGVHLNVNVPRPEFVSMARGYLPPVSEFSSLGLAYLATAADCVWNPHDWNDLESWQRATRFVEIMQPLVSEKVNQEEGVCR